MERIPLKHIQKEQVYKLWLEDHIEEDYHRKNNLLVFCEENNCDIILSIECIIENIRETVLIKYKSRGRDIFEYFKEDNDYYQLNSKLCDIVGNREDCYESEAVYFIFKNNNGEYKRDNTVNTCIESVSKKAVEDDVEFLTKWKEEILADEGDKINNNNNSIIPETKQSLGKLNESETRELYNICNVNVFKYCILENFVNSLNNPQECNLEVKKNSLLYVLYSWFYNIFDDNIEERIKQLNDKFGIKEETYRKKKSLSNKSEPQKDFEEKLQAVWDVN